MPPHLAEQGDADAITAVRDGMGIRVEPLFLSQGLDQALYVASQPYFHSLYFVILICRDLQQCWAKCLWELEVMYSQCTVEDVIYKRGVAARCAELGNGYFKQVGRSERLCKPEIPSDLRGE
jgi:hypothetical protein